jgi:hypothetical protein
MKFSEQRTRAKIAAAKAELDSIDERLGKLMSLRVDREERLARLYDRLTSNGCSI